jgi:hypothetical protein
VEAVELLKKAIEKRQNIKIAYRGGSYPNQIRSIYPLKLQSDRLIARCIPSNIVKTFMLEKISVAYDANGPEWGTSIEKKYNSLNEFKTKNIDQLQNKGWHITFDFQDDRGVINLHKKRKNGKPFKKVEICIGCTPDYFYKTQYDIKSNRYIEKKCKVRKPWYVSQYQHRETKNYSCLDDAAEEFFIRVERIEL